RAARGGGRRGGLRAGDGDQPGADPGDQSAILPLDDGDPPAMGAVRGSFGRADRDLRRDGCNRRTGRAFRSGGARRGRGLVMRAPGRGLVALLGLLLTAAAPTPDAPVAPVYPDVRPGAVFRFPADHGAHPAFRTEWWYVTGWLRTKDGRD